MNNRERDTPLNNTQHDLDIFTKSYIEAALWSTGDGELESLDNFEVSSDTAEKMAEDCRAFVQTNEKLLEKIDPSQAGHDFWLTRCGHGAGFWDRGLGKVGEELTKAAQEWGNVDLFLNDDQEVEIV